MVSGPSLQRELDLAAEVAWQAGKIAMRYFQGYLFQAAMVCLAGRGGGGEPC